MGNTGIIIPCKLKGKMGKGKGMSISKKKKYIIMRCYSTDLEPVIFHIQDSFSNKVQVYWCTFNYVTTLRHGVLYFDPDFVKHISVLNFFNLN